MNFSSEGADAFRPKYHEVAKKFRTEGVSFLIGDLETSKSALQVNSCSSILLMYLFSKTLPPQSFRWDCKELDPLTN